MVEGFYARRGWFARRGVCGTRRRRKSGTGNPLKAECLYPVFRPTPGLASAGASSRASGPSENENEHESEHESESENERERESERENGREGSVPCGPCRAMAERLSLSL